jgi:transcription-repair coupling factor (superfamily II helicase)
LPIPSSIPSEYIGDRSLRLNLYRRMARLRSRREVASLQEELHDRFGPLPEELRNLILQLEMKLAAHRAGVESIGVEGNQVLLQLSGDPEERGLPALGADVRESKRGLWLPRQNDWIRRLSEVLQTLAEFRERRSGSHPPAS